jgi:hypothetical protein
MSDTQDLTTHRFPAHVSLYRATDEKLLSLLEKRIDASMMESNQPVFWRARISNNELDSYFTKMAVSSLKNYAADAKTGVPFQDSHNTRSITYTLGRSLAGEYISLDENKRASVEADFYTLQGIDPIIDTFINKMRADLVSDVSIGFIPGEYRCSICGRDMLDWNWDNWEDACMHWPGVEYAKEKGGEKILCTATVEHARLSEVSVVADGATPGAMILKAERMIEAGKMPSRMARTIENTYHVRLLGARELFLPASLTEESMDPTKRQALGDATVEEADVPETPPAPEPVAEPAVAPVERSASEAEQGYDAARAFLMSKNLMRSTSLVDSIRALLDENDSLRAKATDGEQYRTDLVADALTHGTRAYGNTFKADMYRGMLQSMSIENIRQMRDDWKGLGDAAIPTGRRTVDEPIPTTKTAGDPSLHRA